MFAADNLFLEMVLELNPLYIYDIFISFFMTDLIHPHMNTAWAFLLTPFPGYGFQDRFIVWPLADVICATLLLNIHCVFSNNM